MPSKDQWGDWKYHPCTIAMIKALKEDREIGFEEISYGGEDNNLIYLGVKLGKINALTGIINYSFIPQEEPNDRESGSAGDSGTN